MECKFSCAGRICMGVEVNKQDKQSIVEELHAAWSESSAGVVAQYRGLTVTEMGSLRRDLNQAGVSLQVVKNTLARRAAEDTGFKAAEELFTGPVAIAYGTDPVGMAKAMADFAKDHMQSPISGFVRTLNEIPGSFVRVLAAIRDQKEAA